MVAMARSMLARVAATGAGLSIWLLPENSITLKVSVGRRWPIRLRSNVWSASKVPVLNVGSLNACVWLRLHAAFFATEGISRYMLKIAPSSMPSDSSENLASPLSSSSSAWSTASRTSPVVPVLTPSRASQAASITDSSVDGGLGVVMHSGDQ